MPPPYKAALICALYLALVSQNSHCDELPTSIQATPGFTLTLSLQDNTRDVNREAWFAAITAAAEARGEPDPQKAMRLVIEVILNRVRDQHMGDSSVQDVVTRRWQFSCWNHDSLMLADLEHLSLGKPSNARDLEAAALSIYPIALDLIEGSLPISLDANVKHYVALAHAQPTWAVDAKLVLKHGHHSFFHVDE